MEIVLFMRIVQDRVIVDIFHLGPAQDLVGPVRGSPKEEIQRLDELPPEPTVRLRRSWVRLSTGDHRRALRELNPDCWLYKSGEYYKYFCRQNRF